MTVRFLAANWPLSERVIAGTTLRTGGSSADAYASLNLGAHVGDDPERVAANRARLQRSLELPGTPAWLRQVHGRRVVDAEGSAGEEGDASVTARDGIVCAVLTADCLPVLFASEDAAAVGAAHAGWRGLAAGILESTVAALPCPASSVLAWMGPAISQSAFEVGAEVRERFVSLSARSAQHFTENARGRFQCDLYGLARERLEGAGVGAVYGGDRCTYGERDAFFSYRRQGQCGRMASLIFRRPGAQESVKDADTSA